jgi:hypothetical protein
MRIALEILVGKLEENCQLEQLGDISVHAKVIFKCVISIILDC